MSDIIARGMAANAMSSGGGGGGGTTVDAYSKNETDNLLRGKANASDVYTSQQTDDLLDDKVDKVSGKGLSTNDYTNEDMSLVKTISNKANTNDVNASITNLQNQISETSENVDTINTELMTNAGYSLGMSINPTTFELTMTLKNSTGGTVSSQRVDLPIESMVVSASYANGKLSLKLQNGQTLDTDISAIVAGLVNQNFTIAGIDMKDNIEANELKTALGINTITSDVSTLKNDMSTAKTNISTIQSDISGLKTRDSELQSDIDENTTAIEQNKSDISSIEAMLDIEKQLILTWEAGAAYVNGEYGKWNQSNQLYKDTSLPSSEKFKSSNVCDVRAYTKELRVSIPDDITAYVYYCKAQSYDTGLQYDCFRRILVNTGVFILPSDVEYVAFSIRNTSNEGLPDINDVHFFISTDKKINEEVTKIAYDVEILNALHKYREDYLSMNIFSKIGVIGDSLSVGWANDKNGNRARRNTNISWVQQMARLIGCNAYNLGASGVSANTWFAESAEEWDDPDSGYDYCFKQYKSTEECDLYIIGLGLNGGTLGSIGDIKSDYTQNGATFYGQYARIIQTINHDHPNAIVMCLTEPTPQINNYDQAVRDICNSDKVNALLVDLEQDYFYLFNTPEITAEKQPDGLHYTPHGYSLIANAMIKTISDYVSKNSEKFKYVGVEIV